MEIGGDFCCFHVRVKCSLRKGQSLAISGTSVAFQSKDFHAIALVTTPESYPIWYTKEPIVLPRGEIIFYKYCVVEGGKIKAQEESSTPRRLIPDDAHIVVEDEANLSLLQRSQSDKKAGLIDEVKPVKQTISENDLDWINMGQRQCRLFLVCYHLPVSIKRTNRPSDPFEVSWSESLIAKTEGSIAQSLKTIWIGTISLSTKDLTSAEKDYLLSVLHNMDCFPVFLDDQVASDMYYGFCKMVMWPVFHNVDQLDHIHAAWNLPTDYYDSQKQSAMSNLLGGNRSRSGSRVFDGIGGNSYENKVLEWNKQEVTYHQAFMQVNETFKSTILELVRPEDIVWVHDYHLMMVPKMLRSVPDFAQRNVKIVFFLHIPFPTSQIFRTLPEATQLLQSMLCADLVGFHAFDHARHFLNASRRMLGHRSHTRPGGMITVGVKDREVIVTMNHVSIETNRIQTVMPEALKLAEELKEKYKGKKVILGIDVCQRLSGLALKMAAFEKFIADYGSGNVVLVQKCIRQGSRMEDEETTSNDMRKMVKDINNKYAPKTIAKTLLAGEGENLSSVVVEYEEVSNYRGMGLKQRLALYLVADVMLLTPIREGLNLIPLEYIYARKDEARAGVVVVSEFSTCSCLLNGSLKVNPFAPLAVADAMEKALSLPSKECEYRRQRDLPFISAHPSSLWTKKILSELEQFQSKSGRGRTTALKLPDSLPVKMLSYAYQAAAKDNDLVRSASRVFIFEYGGVLLHKEMFDIYIKQTLSAIAGRRPSDQMMDLLKKLSDDENNVVIIMTGLTQLKLGDTFKDLPNVILATSNGLVYSWGERLSKRSVQAATTDRNWECMSCNVDWTAVASIAVPIITRYTFRTNGTCQTPRFPGIGWSYFGADPEWGMKQAAQLTLELEAALLSHDVKVISLIPGSIEVVPKTLHKGLIISQFMERILQHRAGKLPGLVTVVGGEESDEEMMKAVFDVVGRAPIAANMRGCKIFTVTVGMKESIAQYYVNDVKDVEKLLSPLVAGDK